MGKWLRRIRGAIGIGLTWLLVGINIVGIQEAARLNIATALASR